MLMPLHSLSQLASDETLSLQASATGIVIASAVNSIVKLGIVYWMGGRKIGTKVSLFFLAMLGMMGIGLWVNKLILP